MGEQTDTRLGRLAAGDGDPEFAFAAQNHHFQLHTCIAEYSGGVELREIIQGNNVPVFNWLYTRRRTQMAARPRQFPLTCY